MWSLAEYAQSVRDLGASFGAVVLRVLATPRPPGPPLQETELLPAPAPRHVAGPPVPPRALSASAATSRRPTYRSARSSVGRRQGRGRL
jgi:hypothetical protein